MKDDKHGLYRKFYVERADGATKHWRCEYFVLDLNHDKHAMPALVAYAKSCEKQFPQLASDLREKVKAFMVKAAGKNSK